MKINISHNTFCTNDKIIRIALRSVLRKDVEKHRFKTKCPAEIFEEFNVKHGTARIDMAVVNGVIHGYEIKSDRDTLERLPEQMNEFNNVFDKLTLVVGKRHLHKAMYIVPDWWGIVVAKINTNNQVVFHTIRKPENNQKQTRISMAQLLWRKEALQVLEEQNKAKGVRSKPREFIYKRLADILNTESLRKQVSALLISREGWRSDVPLILDDG